VPVQAVAGATGATEGDARRDVPAVQRRAERAVEPTALRVLAMPYQQSDSWRSLAKGAVSPLRCEDEGFSSGDEVEVPELSI
jgi:hypothetical protein